MIVRGRKFLIAEQLDDGSWTETTRPPGNISYAERIPPPAGRPWPSWRPES